MVGSPGELEFGSKGAPGWFIPENRFADLWHGPRPVYALVSRHDVATMKHKLDPVPVLLGMEGPWALIVNRCPVAVR